MNERLTPNLPAELALTDDDVVEDVEVIEEEPEERVSGFDGIGTRREARERALSLLYEAEQRQLSVLADVLDDLPVRPETFACELVVGVSDHQAQIDDVIRRYSTSWSLERMPAIDRALLRLGTFELVFTDVPTGAVISEAIELAKRYSTDDSHRFVNGMLARVADEGRTLPPTPDGEATVVAEAPVGQPEPEPEPEPEVVEPEPVRTEPEVAPTPVAAAPAEVAMPVDLVDLVEIDLEDPFEIDGDDDEDWIVEEITDPATGDTVVELHHHSDLDEGIARLELDHQPGRWLRSQVAEVVADLARRLVAQDGIAAVEAVAPISDVDVTALFAGLAWPTIGDTEHDRTWRYEGD